MFLEGKTTGTFKSIDEPVYVAFVSLNFILSNCDIVYEKSNICIKS